METTIHSATACVYIAVFALLFMYIYAVIGVATFGHNDPFCFGNLGRAMITLMRVLTVPRLLLAALYLLLRVVLLQV